MNRKRGFTLVELMIVVAILGVLGMIAIPMYQRYLGGAKMSEARSNLETIRLLEEQVYADRKTYVASDAAVGTSDLVAKLPGFEPGKDATAGIPDPYHALAYTYSVAAGSTGDIATSFTATATPKAGTPGLFKQINEKNEKTNW